MRNADLDHSSILRNPHSSIRNMKLYVEPMDAVVVDVDAEGRIRLDGEDWHTPSLQERRAIIYAARQERESLDELLEILEKPDV
ncbi:MAG: hypothetical protein LAO77_24750 [Acidobacteriia bacterium]|nr:hypothetical protein [Terriglobia bacterium]